MIKTLVKVFLYVCLLAVLIMPAPALAENGPEVISSLAEIDFPMRITFEISAVSDVEINDIRLHYQVDRMEHVQITSEIYVQFTPAMAVDTEWVWDMRKTGGLPPGSSVVYWWTVTDAGGKSIKTRPETIYIEDERYVWNSISEGNVTLYWYEGSHAFGEGLMSATREALSRLAEDTGAELEDTVKIYIYASSEDLKGSMIFPQEWTGGVAFTQHGVIAIGIPPTKSGIEWGERVIAHELTHLVIHRVTFNPYSDIPTWLDEGLAMNAEGDLGPWFVAALSSADGRDEFITVRSLSSPFSAYSGESMLAYAQSREIVSYLIDEYGREMMFDLLNTFQRGAGYDEALEAVYGFDMDGLNERWLDHYFGGGATSPPVTPVREGIQSLQYGLLAGVSVAILLLLALFIKQRMWRRNG